MPYKRLYPHKGYSISPIKTELSELSDSGLGVDSLLVIKRTFFSTKLPQVSLISKPSPKVFVPIKLPQVQNLPSNKPLVKIQRT